MRKAVWTTYYHKISTVENPQHSYCAEGPESWCKWRKAEAAKTLEDNKHPFVIDDKIRDTSKPMYNDFISDNYRKMFGADEHAKEQQNF